jgi:hypothetical protein
VAHALLTWIEIRLLSWAEETVIMLKRRRYIDRLSAAKWLKLIDARLMKIARHNTWPGRSK